MFSAPFNNKVVESPILTEADLKATKCFKEYPKWLVKGFLNGTIKFYYNANGGWYLRIRYLEEMHSSTVSSGGYLVYNSRGRLEAWSREAFKEAYQHIRKPKNDFERGLLGKLL